MKAFYGLLQILRFYLFHPEPGDIVTIKSKPNIYIFIVDFQSDAPEEIEPRPIGFAFLASDSSESTKKLQGTGGFGHWFGPVGHSTFAEDKRFCSLYAQAALTISFTSNPQRREFLQICYPVIKAKWELELQLKELKDKNDQVSLILPKLLNSKFYSNKTNLFDRLNYQIYKLMNQCRDLIETYNQVVNELVLAYEILDLNLGLLDLDSFPEPMNLDHRLKEVRTEFAQIQEELRNYKLLKISQDLL